jgi:hypothetical protein
MVINQVVRRLVRSGVDKGFDLATRKGKRKEDMTAEDHEQAKMGRDMAKRAKDMSKITRRLNR